MKAKVKDYYWNNGTEEPDPETSGEGDELDETLLESSSMIGVSE
ncbi:MAG: hypothetical protein U9N72_05215 [Bacteroidota bacterium]|nr:hypothetical protein [Bacteroidota bacterium]